MFAANDSFTYTLSASGRRWSCSPTSASRWSRRHSRAPTPMRARPTSTASTFPAGRPAPLHCQDANGTCTCALSIAAAPMNLSGTYTTTGATLDDLVGPGHDRLRLLRRGDDLSSCACTTCGRVARRHAALRQAMRVRASTGLGCLALLALGCGGHALGHDGGAGGTGGRPGRAASSAPTPSSRWAASSITPCGGEIGGTWRSDPKCKPMTPEANRRRPVPGRDIRPRRRRDDRDLDFRPGPDVHGPHQHARPGDVHDAAGVPRRRERPSGPLHRGVAGVRPRAGSTRAAWRARRCARINPS